jgi:ABC-type branched-subunit amino acid transport system ATPase component/branched-subunit amino acid ABC-type transport system permease component
LTRDDIRFASGAALGTLAFTVFVFVLYPVPVSSLVMGLFTGSLSALIAIGLVLVYRANRIVNFAQGELGGLAAVLAASLIVGPGWGFFPAMVVGLVAAVALGAAIEILIVRRFAKAPRLLLTVATIGIGQLLSFGTLALPRLFSYDTAPQPPRPFGSVRVEWFPNTFSGGHLLIAVFVPAICVGLAVFLRRTRFGIAVRASAESADRAALLGIPVSRLNTLVWMLAAGLSGLAVLLRMPIQGVAIGETLGLSLLLRALAAAVVGRMERLPVTVAAALGLGVLEQAVFFETGRTVVVDGVLFGVIIVALLVQRRGGVERARDLGASTWQAVREVRPIPRELSGLKEVRAAKAVGAAVLVAALVLYPLHMAAGDVFTLSVGLLFGMLMLSLVVLTGWAGQISLGQLAIAAIGAAASATLHFQGKDFFLCVAVAGLVGAGLAIALGVPALRIQGPFLAVTTMAFALATGTYFLNREFFRWLVPDPNQRFVRPVIFDKFDLESEHSFYYVALAGLLLTIASVSRIQRSRTGRALVANRDNTRAAQSYGISPVRAQISAFGLSGAIAGLAGGLYAFAFRGISGTVVTPESNVLLLAIGVIGGLSSVPGAMLAAVYMTFVKFSPFTRSDLTQFLASGVGLLGILLVLPGGLGGLLYDLRDRALRRLAVRRQIDVPSLVADARVADGDAPMLDDPSHLIDPTVEIDVTAVRPLAGDDALLVVRDLEVAYGKTQVLFGVDFHVERGEIVALLGTNGAGKSTLLSAVCGLVKPIGGTVHFEGEDITGQAPQATVAQGVVLMPGGKGVFPTLTVEENLQLAGWLFHHDPDHVRTATEQVLEFFPVLRERWDQRAGNLSGGEQQMLTLGQAFIARPRLLLIDELSLGLAPIVVEQLLGIVRAIHANGTTVVLVEQSVNVAITLAERAVFLEKGEVRFDGPTAGLLDRPEILRAVFLEGATATNGAAPAARTNGTAASGHRTFTAHCEHCGHEHPVSLELHGISTSFGGVKAVNDVDLAVRQGQILGIIGPNGAGKTTVLDLISGFVTPTAGRVLLEGDDVTELAASDRSERGLGRSFQDARLFPSMTVRQTIATACERHVLVRDPISPFVLSPAVKPSERAVAAEVDELIELMRLQAYADKFVGELSTGTRRIVDLACTLAHRPSVLLLDEPSSGIAQRETEALGPVLLDIRDKTGAAMVVIEHDMPLITGISDQLLALELGAVVATGSPAEVLSNARVVEGYLGTTEETIMRSGTLDRGAQKAPPKPRAKRGTRREEPLVAEGTR